MRKFHYFAGQREGGKGESATKRVSLASDMLRWYIPDAVGELALREWNADDADWIGRVWAPQAVVSPAV